MLPDDELLAFDHEELHTIGGPYDGRRMLEEHGDVFRSQLLMARWLDWWAQRICEEPSSMEPGTVYVLTNTLLSGRIHPTGPVLARRRLLRTQ